MLARLVAGRGGEHPQGGGDRRADYLVRMHVEAVQDMMAEGRSRRHVIEQMATIGIPERTVDRYIQKARDLWRADRAAARPSELEASLHRLGHLSRRYESDHPAQAVACERLMAEIRGVRAPEKLEVAPVEVNVNLPAIDLSDLSEAVIAELRRKAERLRDLTQPPILALQEPPGTRGGGEEAP